MGVGAAQPRPQLRPPCLQELNTWIADVVTYRGEAALSDVFSFIEVGLKRQKGGGGTAKYTVNEWLCP